MKFVPLIIALTFAVTGCVANRVTTQRSEHPPTTVVQQPAPSFEYGYEPAVILLVANAQRRGLSFNRTLHATTLLCLERRDRAACEAYVREIVTQAYWPDHASAITSERAVLPQVD